VDALALAVERYSPRLVWLAMRMAPDGDAPMRGVVRLAEQLSRSGATLVLGGQGAPVLPPHPGLLQVRTMAELSAFARGIRVVLPANS
jgi:hypothetical protein